MTTMTMGKSLNSALQSAMRRDDRVLVMGEDVGRLGGVFRITCDGVQIWERKADGGFPEAKVLKQRVRDQIDPARDLGHNDRS